jgi:hypothetical protein
MSRKRLQTASSFVFVLTCLPACVCLLAGCGRSMQERATSGSPTPWALRCRRRFSFFDKSCLMIRLGHVDDQANPANGLRLVFSVPSFVERRLANRKPPKHNAPQPPFLHFLVLGYLRPVWSQDQNTPPFLVPDPHPGYINLAPCVSGSAPLRRIIQGHDCPFPIPRLAKSGTDIQQPTWRWENLGEHCDALVNHHPGMMDSHARQANQATPAPRPTDHDVVLRSNPNGRRWWTRGSLAADGLICTPSMSCSMSRSLTGIALSCQVGDGYALCLRLPPRWAQYGGLQESKLGTHPLFSCTLPCSAARMDGS